MLGRPGLVLCHQEDTVASQILCIWTEGQPSGGSYLDRGSQYQHPPLQQGQIHLFLEFAGSPQALMKVEHLPSPKDKADQPLSPGQENLPRVPTTQALKSGGIPALPPDPEEPFSLLIGAPSSMPKHLLFGIDSLLPLCPVGVKKATW